MAISTSRVIGALALFLAYGFILTPITTINAAVPDPCGKFNSSCTECLNETSHLDIKNCSYYYDGSTVQCSNTPIFSEAAHQINNTADCTDEPTPPPTPSTTTVPTTSVPTTTASTTTPTAPTTTPLPINTTTTAPPAPTTPTTPAPTNTTTTPAPTNTTTTASPPTTTAAPSHGGGGMSWTSFFGGIVFTAAISAVGYLVWRFYRARQERNYHTLTTNLI